MNDNKKDVLEDEVMMIKLKLVESLSNYRQIMNYMASDAPIGILGLPKTLEKVLCTAGCFRIYDLIDRDLTKIKGIGRKRQSLLTSSLDKFLSMS